MSICILLCTSCVFFKQNTAYEMRISDWSSDVCSSDLHRQPGGGARCIGACFVRQLAMGDARPCLGQGAGGGDLRGPALYRAVAAQLASHARMGGGAGPVLDHILQPGPEQLHWPPHLAGEERSEEHTSELQSLMRISY